jgi:SAM-dependent methyltransferase
MNNAWDWENVKDEYWMKPDGFVMAFGQALIETEQKKIFDLACGMGRHVKYLAGLGLDVFGCDSSEYSVNYVNEWLESQGIEKRIQLIDMIELNEKDNEYDAVLAFHAIYHNTYENMMKVIKKIWRMLKPDGVALVTFLFDAEPTSETIEKREFIKNDGPEQGIPHVVINKEYIPKILDKFLISQIWNVEHIYDSGKRGYHCIAEIKAMKKGEN